MSEMTKNEMVETMSAIIDTANIAFLEGRMEEFENLMTAHREYQAAVEDFDPDLSQCSDLNDLLGAMMRSEMWPSDLPTFGGPEPRDTLGVWSWDNDRLLIGSFHGDLTIVTRAEWDE